MLEGSLIAALISDLGGCHQNQAALDNLRVQLRQLSLDAESQFVESCDDSDQPSAAGSIFGVRAVPTIVSYANSELIRNAAIFRMDKLAEYGEVIRFLEAAFNPRVKSGEIHRIVRSVLADASDTLGNTKIDIENVIHTLMSIETIHEQEERGNDAPLEEDHSEPEELPGPSRKRRRRFEGRTLKINDVRQQHHIIASTKRSAKAHPRIGAVHLDPWAQLSSLDSYLCTLLSNCPINHFTRYFHNKAYATPAAAVRAALQNLCNLATLQSVEDSAIVRLWEVIIDSFDGFADFTAEERDRLVNDIQVALHVSKDADSAHQLVTRLIELDLDERGGMTQGLYHSEPEKLSRSSHTQQTSKPAWSQSRPDGSSDPLSVPIPSRANPAVDSWTTIPVRPKSLHIRMQSSFQRTRRLPFRKGGKERQSPILRPWNGKLKRGERRLFYKRLIYGTKTDNIPVLPSPCYLRRELDDMPRRAETGV